MSRDPSAAALPAGVDVVRGDVFAPDTLRPHLAGVEAVFLVWPAFNSEGAEPVVDLIADHAKRVVFVSALGAPGCYAEIEALIQRTGLDWTFLRPSGFAANTLEWAAAIRSGDVVRLPFAQAARSLIDEHDIAAVATRALTEDGHAGAAYDLTGPGVLTQADQLRVIGDVVGKRVLWQEIPPDVARREMHEQGFPVEFIDSGLEYWSHLVTDPEPVTATVEQLTGTPARTYRQWVEEHAGAFR